MGYSEEQIENLSIAIKNHFPEINSSIKKLNKNIEMMNLLQLVKLNQKIKVLSPKEEKDVLQKVKEYYLNENKTYKKSREIVKLR